MKAEEKRHAKKRRKKADDGSGRVTVYASPRSVACRVLLDCLATWEIPHQVRNIVRDQRAKTELARLTRGSTVVPVVRIGKRVLRNPTWNQLVIALVTCPGVGRRA
jgi:hypothetical protein